MVVNMTVGLVVVGVGADVVTESLSDVVTGGVVNLEYVVLVSYFVEVLCDAVAEALYVGIGVEVLADVNLNVSAAVMTALEFPL